jgi:hypothetical protein
MKIERTDRLDPHDYPYVVLLISFLAYVFIRLITGADA